MQALTRWFSGLGRREQVLVASAAVLAVVAVLVIGVARPLATTRGAALERLETRRAVLADIERVAARFGPNAGAGIPASQPGSESLVVLVDRTTRAGGLGAYLKRNEPDGDSSIRLRFENAPFDELVKWLAGLQASQGIGVVAASADPGREAGRVDANLQLSRATAAR
ncbi:MAG: type II secretion system protein M [Gammaproteobacteria bacterium]|nr:type II secretion system protein M [Gammaproteobacteria bacterium]